MKITYITDDIRFRERHKANGGRLHDFNGFNFFFEDGEPIVYLPPVGGIRNKELIALKKYIEKYKP